jgi:hypothetical protein
VEYPIAAVPAWEMETWWMLFPEALSRVRACWRKVDYTKRKVGLIENSKEVLQKDLRPKQKNGRKCPDYAESNSERIAEEIALQGLARLPGRVARSASLQAFQDQLREVYDPAPADD